MFPDIEAVVQRCSVKKVFLKISQSSQENTCEFCEISKNTFFYRTPLMAAPADRGRGCLCSIQHYDVQMDFKLKERNLFQLYKS